MRSLRVPKKKENHVCREIVDASVLPARSVCKRFRKRTRRELEEIQSGMKKKSPNPTPTATPTPHPGETARSRLLCGAIRVPNRPT